MADSSALPNYRAAARAYVVSIGVWCALSLLTGWQYRIFDEQLNIHSTFLEMLLLAESRGFGYALLTPPIFYLVRRYGAVSKHSSWYVWAAFAAGMAPFMLLFASIRWLVLPPWDPALQRYVSRSAAGPIELIRAGFADQITMYIAILVAAYAYEYFERVRKQELETYEFRRALAASELQVLRMQLHPHFLFNTLHGISTLIDSDQQNAKSMVIKLSNLLRRAFKIGESDLIPLEEELGFIDEYLELEKMRFGMRLHIDWWIDPETNHLLVPQMILQPLVENAIRHGIASSRDKGWIRIESRTHAGLLELTITNSVGGHHPPGNGIGLQNTETRLRHLFTDQAYFSFSIADQTAFARMAVPAFRQDSNSEADEASKRKITEVEDARINH